MFTKYCFLKLFGDFSISSLLIKPIETFIILIILKKWKVYWIRVLLTLSRKWLSPLVISKTTNKSLQISPPLLSNIFILWKYLLKFHFMWFKMCISERWDNKKKDLYWCESKDETFAEEKFVKNTRKIGLWNSITSNYLWKVLWKRRMVLEEKNGN